MGTLPYLPGMAVVHVGEASVLVGDGNGAVVVDIVAKVSGVQL
jgi:hypothetical protein